MPSSARRTSALASAANSALVGICWCHIYLRHKDICCIALLTGWRDAPPCCHNLRQPEPPTHHVIAAGPLTMPTIALVDDERNILTSLRMVLEAEGYKAQTYNDGAAALDGFCRESARPRHPRHQDAAHGRHGAAAPPAPADRPAGDLPHLQGRGDRRAVRPQDGRRRLHPQAVLATAAGRAGQGGAAAGRSRATPPPTRSRTSRRCSSAAS